MSIPAGAAPGRAIESPEATRPAAARVRSLSWSVRRELWQNRSILIGPLVVGFILIASFVLGMITMPERVAGLIALLSERHDALGREHGFAAAAAAAIVAMGGSIVGVFYCLDALQGERLDRSILFWKSLPVSGVTPVLAKACIPLVVLPLLVFAVTLAVQGLMPPAGPFAPSPDLAPTRAAPPPVIDHITQLDPAAVFGRPAVWIGLGAAAAFLLVAIRLRRDREPA